MRALVLLVAAIVAMPWAAATAQTIEATPIPAPRKPDFSAFRFLVGTWSCSGKSSRRPSAIESTVTWSADDTGFWMIAKTESKPASWAPRAITYTDMVTYDFDAKRWVDVNTSTEGDYDVAVSKGWVGPRIRYHSLAFVPTAQIASFSDVVYTRVSSTKYTSTYSFTTAKGRIVSVNGVCTKSS